MPGDPFAQTDAVQRSESDLDPKLVELSRDFLDALKAGKSPDRQSYLSQVPELGQEAEDILEGIELAFALEQASAKSGVRTVSHAEPKRNEPIGEFRIIRELGRGGMGTVYEALQTTLGRHVALKVLPFAAALDERHRKRFLLEAQAAAQLHHNHIVPVYAVGCDRGTHYYAMQLIDGQPVSSKLLDTNDGPSRSVILPNGTRSFRDNTTQRFSHPSIGASSRSVTNRFERIASLIADAAEGLDYAHSCGIVHRDVKPGNLLLDATGKIWITDFGLAHISAADHLTQTGDMLGTMRYMSPEQASGSRGVVDHRSDIYSLGATLYELLSHEPVFDGPDRQTLLNQILHDEPRPLRSINRAIPEELEVVTHKALRHSPSERYETAKHFADDLRRYLDQIPITARRPTTIEKTRKWMRRHPSILLSLVFAMGFSVFLLAATTLVVGHQKSLTEQSLQREQLRAAQAERRLATAQAAADEMISLAENEFSHTPLEETLRLRLLSSALHYYQSLIDESGLEPDVEAQLRATRNKVSKIHSELTLVRKDREVTLLTNPAVVDDLQLDDSQRQQLSAIASILDQAPNDADAIALAHRRQAAIEAILSSNQRLRLKQIATQLQGPSAILEMIFSGEMKLSEPQLSAIQQAIFRQMMTAHVNSAGLPFPANLANQTGDPSSASTVSTVKLRPDDMLTDEMKRQVMDVVRQQLTPEQLETWTELTGKRFDPK